MQFILNGKRVIIKGKDVGEVTTDSTHQMERILQNPSETFLVQLREVGSTNLSSVEVRELEVLLSKFLDIFEEPKGLPPKRLHDPLKPLLPGSRAANVRPYRYPYIQKVEIENILQEMLDAGIVRPSISPHS